MWTGGLQKQTEEAWSEHTRFFPLNVIVFYSVFYGRSLSILSYWHKELSEMCIIDVNEINLINQQNLGKKKLFSFFVGQASENT